MMAVSLPLVMSGVIDFSNAELVGYTSMILSFVAVFFGIRTYRDNVAGGAITFGRAVTVGILIVFIASAIYVVSWEIIYFNFIPDFGDKYAAFTLDEMRREGASAAELAAHQREMERFKELYANPLFNVGITFLEVFPVGLVVTLVSAGILRKKPDVHAPATAVA
jgi:hypothetical protein